ncbi:MAG: J domain-containing protein [Acidobacteria bacterium]|nr:J domain-containing protein [Acidobacteriota bacterium]
MIPTLEKLKAIAALRTGDIAEVPFAHLVLALAVNGHSAVLEMKRTPLEKQIVFDDGAPVDCVSNVATETLGRFMISLGKLTESEYHTVLNASIAKDVPFEELLVEHEIVSPTDLYKLLQQNLARKLLDGFSWASGTFRISHDLPQVGSPLRVRPAQLLVTGIARFASQRDVDESVSSMGEKKLALNPAPLFPLEEIRLTEEQHALTRALSTAKSVAELGASVASEAEELNRLLYPLLLLRIAIPEDELPAAAQEPAVLPKMELEASVATEELAVPFLKQVVPSKVELEEVVATSRDDLMRVYLSFRRRDPFDLFDLQENATLSVINAAWESFARKFAPWTFASDTTEALQEKAQEIFYAGARAYAELADAERRAMLIEKRRAAREKPKPITSASATPVPAAAPSSVSAPVLLDPEAQHRLGRQLAEAGRHREALSHFQFAAECDAQNGVYQAEVIYSRFQLMATTATQALGALKEVMRIDPKCGLAWFYAGKVHQTLGNTMEAEAYLDRGKNMMTLAKRGRR